VVFYIAGIFIDHYGEDSKNCFLAIYIIFMAAIGSGITFSYAPSISKAKHAASKIFAIRDELSKIDCRDPSGKQ
jgi:hypothetical protein